MAVKDSGKRQEFGGGMVRDVTEGKIDYSLVFDGPMLERWAKHLTEGAKKYQSRNWLLACDVESRERFRASAVRHFVQWLRGDTDEDHAAAVIFNLNGHAYVSERLANPVPVRPIEKTWPPEWVALPETPDVYCTCGCGLTEKRLSELGLQHIGCGIPVKRPIPAESEKHSRDFYTMNPHLRPLSDCTCGTCTQQTGRSCGPGGLSDEYLRSIRVPR